MTGTRKQFPEVSFVASVSLFQRRSGVARTSWLIALVALGVVAVALVWQAMRPAPRELVARGFIALTERRFEDALKLADEAVSRDPGLTDAYRLGADVAVAQQDYRQAVRWQQRLLKVGAPDEVRDALWKIADWQLMKLYQPNDAEETFRVLMADPAAPLEAKREFASLLGMTGRVFEALQLRVDCLRAGDVRDVDLILLGLGETSSENVETLKLMAKTSPDDPLVKLGLARAAFQSHDLKQAGALVRAILQRRQDLPDALALLGLVLLESNEPGCIEALKRWSTELNDVALAHPSIWFVRGAIAEKQGQAAVACRCYWEAVRHDPTHHQAHYRLGRLLAGVGHEAAGRDFAERAARLQQLLLETKSFNLSHEARTIQRIVPLCVECGLMWEVRSWSGIAQTMGRSIKVPEFDASSPRVIANHDLGQRWKLNDLPLPNERSTSSSSREVAQVGSRSSVSDVKFVDDAAVAGLSFRFVSGDDLSQPGMRMFEFTGGGVGVLDFDADGWPDLFLTQGGQWPLDQPTQRSLDRLFRNDGHGHFEDVTSHARLVEDRYSQGIAIGDINQDGFDDVYVANLGLDRLFINNGDGTFSDLTESAGLRDDDWSTSCVLADFNGDSLPDCYVVNYLRGADLATRVCRNSDGRIRACTPHEFAAAPDRLLLNQGDGTFADITQSAGIDDTNGKGLGVVALDADGSGRLSVFVANDTTGNFLWTPTADSTRDAPRFVDRALLAGVGFDRDGRSQACMGVAAGDSNGDGLIDLLVTNYYDESNTLFRQISGGLFEDVTAQIGLREPSLKKLGFGTQFIDADRDGWLDLMVLNGHVDDETYRGVPFQMQPQFFRNQGAGVFAEVPADSMGAWFARPTLGRSLARLDWNRDGRDDFVATHRDEPVGLLTNQTKPLGSGLSLKLIGTQSNRDAIGATIRIKTSTREIVRQLTAGDGYQASNDRRLLISVPSSERINSLTIRWPNGESQVWPNVPSDHDYIAIEGGDLHATHASSR